MSQLTRFRKYGRNNQFIPEERAIFFVIAKADLAAFLCSDGFPYYINRRLTLVFPLQKSAVTTDYLIHGIPSELHKAWIGIDY
jgi:hypothetical protein